MGAERGGGRERDWGDQKCVVERVNCVCKKEKDYVCVCVSVSEHARAKERERDRERESECESVCFRVGIKKEKRKRQKYSLARSTGAIESGVCGVQCCGPVPARNTQSQGRG